MSATAQTEQPRKGDTSTAGQLILPSPPDCSARTLFAGPIALYPRGRGQWESRAPPRGSFILYSEIKIDDRAAPTLPRSRAACYLSGKYPGGTR